ncbi:MAG: N(5)-(carboxyethyl)ornithine synthase [Erysipelotrichaceae bacterium]|nr:N(5)-(carboxyethyl)ornithine synthase [Erysipelotrichaceae bacterium]
MKTLGFLISHKPDEKRRALLPRDLLNVVNEEQIYVEKGYGKSLRIEDFDYENFNAKVADREEVLRCDCLVDVKLGDGDFLDEIEDGKMLIGWAHALQKTDFTTKCMEAKHTVLAWENIVQDGRYIFYRNRELAGEAGVLQAFTYLGKMPYECRVAILGNGQTARGAMRILHGLGATVDVYPRKLEGLFRKKMYEYDVLVNCIMWDTSREDHIIYRDDLKKFRPGTMIIDISCDPGMEIETARPTTISDPVYEIDGVIHYEVDNTPAMFPYTVSEILSYNFSTYLDGIIIGEMAEELEKAVVIKDGIILDQSIIDYRKKLGLLV